MKIAPTSLPGVHLLDLAPGLDPRGSFTRLWDVDTLAECGLVTDVAAVSLCRNYVEATLRGMHYQRHPGAEAKLVTCTRGAIFDVALDLRDGSATHGQWFATRLEEGGGRALYIPPGCAHGYLTLAANTEVLYVLSAPYSPSLAAGVRWDDPAFHIRWPNAPRVISERDASYPDYRP